MKCSNVTSELHRYRHGELPADQAHRVADHLRDCASCREYASWLEAVVDAAAASDASLAAASLDDTSPQEALLQEALLQEALLQEAGRPISLPPLELGEGFTRQVVAEIVGAQELSRRLSPRVLRVRAAAAVVGVAALIAFVVWIGAALRPGPSLREGLFLVKVYDAAWELEMTPRTPWPLEQDVVLPAGTSTALRLASDATLRSEGPARLTRTDEGVRVAVGRVQIEARSGSGPVLAQVPGGSVRAETGTIRIDVPDELLAHEGESTRVAAIRGDAWLDLADGPHRIPEGGQAVVDATTHRLIRIEPLLEDDRAAGATEAAFPRPNLRRTGIRQLAASMQSARPGVRTAAIRTAALLDSPELAGQLVDVVERSRESVENRIAALEAVANLSLRGVRAPGIGHWFFLEQAEHSSPGLASLALRAGELLVLLHADEPQVELFVDGVAGPGQGSGDAPPISRLRRPSRVNQGLEPILEPLAYERHFARLRRDALQRDVSPEFPQVPLGPGLLTECVEFERDALRTLLWTYHWQEQNEWGPIEDVVTDPGTARFPELRATALRILSMRRILTPKARAQLLDETRTLLRELMEVNPGSRTVADLVTAMRSTRRRDANVLFDSDEDDLRLLLSIVDGGARFTEEARMRAGLAVAAHPLAVEDLVRYVDPLLDAIESEGDLEHRSELLDAAADLTRGDRARFARVVRLRVDVLGALVDDPRDDPEDWRTMLEDGLNQAERLLAQARDASLDTDLDELAKIGEVVAFDETLPGRLRATAMRFACAARPDRLPIFVSLLSDGDNVVATAVASKLGSSILDESDDAFRALDVLARSQGPNAIVGIKGLWRWMREQPDRVDRLAPWVASPDAEIRAWALAAWSRVGGLSDEDQRLRAQRLNTVAQDDPSADVSFVASKLVYDEVAVPRQRELLDGITRSLARGRLTPSVAVEALRFLMAHRNPLVDRASLDMRDVVDGVLASDQRNEDLLRQCFRAARAFHVTPSAEWLAPIAEDDDVRWWLRATAAVLLGSAGPLGPRDAEIVERVLFEGPRSFERALADHGIDIETLPNDSQGAWEIALDLLFALELWAFDSSSIETDRVAYRERATESVRQFLARWEGYRDAIERHASSPDPALRRQVLASLDSLEPAFAISIAIRCLGDDLPEFRDAARAWLERVTENRFGPDTALRVAESSDSFDHWREWWERHARRAARSLDRLLDEVVKSL